MIDIKEKNFDVIISKYSNKKYNKKVLDPAIELFYEVWQDKIFRSWVLHMEKWTHLEKYTSNLEIHRTLFVDKHSPTYVRSFRYRWGSKLYWKRRKARAYHYRGYDWFSVNRRLVKKLPSAAGTIAHEICHVLGFNHGENTRHGTEDSVNYKIGKLVKKRALQLLKEKVTVHNIC